MLSMGKIIRQLRKQNGLTQDDLAEGISSKSALSRMENEMCEPDIFTLNAFMQRLGKSLRYFEIVVSNKEYELLRKNQYDSSLQTIVVAESDFFKDMREARGLSQEQFCAEICARETISNIENGRTPQRKKARVLFESLGETCDKYYSYVETDDFEVFELVEQYQQKIRTNPEAALELRLQIQERIEENHPVNRQFLKSSELLEKKMSGERKTSEVLAGLEQCLHFTMPEYDGKIYRMPRRQESFILDEIVDCLKKMDKTESAFQLEQEIKQKNYKKLKISAKRYSFFK